MSAAIGTILILGGTGGIGEAFARRFYTTGKKVIVTGRREQRLAALSKEMPGLGTYVMDNTDLGSLPGHFEQLLKSYPDINTVWINGGIQYAYSFNEPSTLSDEKIMREINTNVTAPMVIARHLIPHLLSLGAEANFMITSSGLGFVPMGIFPIYCPTKAFVHHFMVGLRQQLRDTKVNVIEIAPPYVATELGLAHGHVGGPPPMPLQEYADKTFAILNGNQAKDLKEVAVGSAALACQAWRGSIGAILEHMQLGG